MRFSDTLQNCLVANICHPSCKTCSSDVPCDNVVSCTSCRSEDYKFSPSSEDKIFKCIEKCEILATEYHDYFYCNSTVVEMMSQKKISTLTSTVSYPSKTPQHNPFKSHTLIYKNLYIIFVLIILVVITIVILVILKRRKANAKNKMAEYQKMPEIIIKDERKFDSSLNLFPAYDPLINPSITKVPKPHSRLQEIKLKDFEKIEIIGGGAFSNVYKGKVCGNYVAIKVAVKNQENNGRKSIYKEIQIYAKISHSHIVPAVGFHLGVENILFLELRKEDLKTYFGMCEQKIEFQQLNQYCIQISDAVKYLHKNKILHCDLKIDNILIRDDNADHVEISDFGCAVDMMEDRESKHVGTVTHKAYELLKKVPNYPTTASEATDVWSFAITAWQIFQKSHKIPCEYWKPDDIVQNYEQGNRLKKPAIVSDRFWQHIFIPCFDLDPSTRPTMEYLYDSLKGFKEESSAVTE